MLKFVTMVCQTRHFRVCGLGFLYGNCFNSRSTPRAIPVLKYEVTNNFGFWILRRSLSSPTTTFILSVAGRLGNRAAEGRSRKFCFLHLLPS